MLMIPMVHLTMSTKFFDNGTTIFSIITTLSINISTVKIKQEPNPARSGGNVTVTCNAKETADLQWKVSDGTVVKFNTKGVTKTQAATSNVLQVDLSVFPYEMTVSCGVNGDNETWKDYTICGEYCTASWCNMVILLWVHCIIYVL